MLNYKDQSIDLAIQTLNELEQEEDPNKYWDKFVNSPIALWDEDFSEVKIYLDSMGINKHMEFEDYLTTHPWIVTESAQRVVVREINQAVLDLFEATSKEKLLNGLETIFTPRSYIAFRKELIDMIRGELVGSIYSDHYTFSGKLIKVKLNWRVIDAHKENLSTVLLSTTLLDKNRN